MTDGNRFSGRSYWFIGLFVFLSLTTSAQYTYLEAGLEYGWLRFDKSGEGVKNTTHREMRLVMTATHRPVRWLAVGGGIGLPVVQGMSFAFPGAEYWSYKKEDDVDDIFLFTKPQTYEYQLNYGLSLHGVARWYVVPTGSFYVEVGYSMVKAKEEITIQRDGILGDDIVDPWHSSFYSEVKPLNYSYKKEHSLGRLHYGMGFLSPISENWVFGMNFLLAREQFPDSAPLTELNYDTQSYGDENTFTAGSKVLGTKWRRRLGVSVGYFF